MFKNTTYCSYSKRKCLSGVSFIIMWFWCLCISLGPQQVVEMHTCTIAKIEIIAVTRTQRTMSYHTGTPDHDLKTKELNSLMLTKMHGFKPHKNNPNIQTCMFEFVIWIAFLILIRILFTLLCILVLVHLHKLLYAHQLYTKHTLNGALLVKIMFHQT